MRGTKAKKIRRQVYGDFAFHAPRRYGRMQKSGAIALYMDDGSARRRVAYKHAKKEGRGKA